MTYIFVCAGMEGCARHDLFIGKGRVTMSRGALFKESQGLAIEMTDRIFDLPPFHGKSSLLLRLGPEFGLSDMDV